MHWHWRSAASDDIASADHIGEAGPSSTPRRRADDDAACDCRGRCPWPAVARVVTARWPLAPDSPQPLGRRAPVNAEALLLALSSVLRPTTLGAVYAMLSRPAAHRLLRAASRAT